MNSPEAKELPPSISEGALIYLVDDEPLLVDLAEMALQPVGYRIKKFSCASTALESLSADPDQPDLLITDYSMSPMNGAELAEQCKRLRPNLKIAMVSGTAGPEVLVSTRVRIDGFLPKPYRPFALVELVRSVLAEKS